MVSKEKQKKKNIAGFTERQLKLLLNYCYVIKKNPKRPVSFIHKNYSFYSRTKSTSDIIKKAIKGKVVIGPELFINSGIEVLLLDDVDNPRKFYEDCKKDKKTTLAIVSHGHWPIFWCKQGANTLKFHDSILPRNGQISYREVSNIFYEEKDSLPIDHYPHRWFEKHWDIYYCLKYPKEKTFREAGKELQIHWDTAREYFLEVLNQCKTLINFFPLGLKNYSPLLVTLKTEYEIGILKGLKNLNRTTYLYKANNTLILIIGIDPTPRAQNHITNKFERLQEMGLIRDLHISTPYIWHKAF